MRPTWLFRAYATATRAGSSRITRARQKRLTEAGVSDARAAEVAGHASGARGTGRLIWFHAASVGESLSILPLITTLQRSCPDAQILVTSVTPSSADILAKRLPAGALHQFAPVDTPQAVARFLTHWRPDALILVESEIWPNMLVACAQASIPVALVGARLSEKSLKRWGKLSGTFRYLTQDVRLVFAQNIEMARALQRLGMRATRVEVSGNLKALADPLPVDHAARASLAAAFADTPLWVAASTHPGEDAILLGAHEILRQTMPAARLILVPRHPERAADIAMLAQKAGFSVARRAQGDAPEADVYLADTLGEMGLWYALAPVVFLAGSLKPIGGHNPFEVAHSGAALISGPHVANFQETYTTFEEHNAVRYAATAPEIADHLCHLLQDAQALDTARAEARSVIADQKGKLDALADQLITSLELSDA